MDAVSDQFTVAIPVQASYEALNKEIKARLADRALDVDRALKLPTGSKLSITDATIEPYGNGVLLTVDYRASRGWLDSMSGRLYIVGVPVFDAAQAELKLTDLKYTAATESLLVKSADWLAHGTLLEALQKAAVINLKGVLEDAKKKANSQLDNLKKQLPPDIGVEIAVEQITIDQLAFAQEGIFVVVSARGKMSARLVGK
jgi:hypothetical protein